MSEENVFQTGSTQPPKSRQGLLALLLVLVVLLGGMVCALSVMNVQLFQMLEDSQAEEEENENNVAFFQNVEDCDTFAQLKSGIELPRLGMVVQDLSDVYRQYQNLPEGLFVLDISDGGPAHRANICIGDILVAINGITVDTAWLDQGSHIVDLPDQPLILTLLRNGTRISVPLAIGE